MKKRILAVLLAIGVGSAVVGLMADEGYEREYGEHDEHHERGADHESEREWERGEGQRSQGAHYRTDAGYALYQTECGDCHMAYPPSMLPAGAWQVMMASLSDHFGDNAELDAGTADEISAFLERNAAGPGGDRYAERMWRSAQGDGTVLRITESDYFRAKHHEISRRMVEDNPEVQRFSRCEACHGGAAEGIFDEHQVRIPGYGHWED